MKLAEMKNLKQFDLISWGTDPGDQGLIEEITKSGIKVLWENNPDLRFYNIDWNHHWLIEIVPLNLFSSHTGSNPTDESLIAHDE